MSAGFMLNWLDVSEGAESAFEDWHNHEHVAERLSIAGFLEGRRYRSIEDRPRKGHSWLIAYDVSELSVLRSQAYAERLNSPTPATRKLVPHLHHVTRTAFDTVASFGSGLGGFLRTIRLRFPEDLSHDRLAGLQKALGEIAVHPAVARIRLGRPDFATTHFKDGTEEGSFTDASAPRAYPWCLTIEATSREGLEAAFGRLVQENDRLRFHPEKHWDQNSYQLVFASRA